MEYQIISKLFLLSVLFLSLIRFSHLRLLLQLHKTVVLSTPAKNRRKPPIFDVDNVYKSVYNSNFRIFGPAFMWKTFLVALYKNAHPAKTLCILSIFAPVK